MTETKTASKSAARVRKHDHAIAAQEIEQFIAQKVEATANENATAAGAAMVGRAALAVYEAKRAGNDKPPSCTAYLRLDAAVAEHFNLAAGTRVRGVARPDGGMSLAVDPASGTKCRREKSRLLVRVRGIFPAPRKAAPVTLFWGEAGTIEVREATRPSNKLLSARSLKHFRSLEGPKGLRRLKFLAANDDKKGEMRTTTAGDECYTPRFLVDAVLDALGVAQFDADFCSMATGGRYDRAVDIDAVEAAWGQTPHALRRVENVVGHVPARQHFTRDSSPLGSLLFPWKVGCGWLNPPYTLRTWAVFLEKAHGEVARGNAGIVVALVPDDMAGDHSRHIYGRYAHRIRLSAQLPFFMRERRPRGEPEAATGAGAAVVRDSIKTIRNNMLVVFGKGLKTRRVLLKLVDRLLALEYVTPEQHEALRLEFNASPVLKRGAK